MPITYNTASAETSKGLIAIIDIGSNSVRMVVYHALRRVPLPVFNEKYMCALGKGLARSGRLNPQGAAQAIEVMGRFLRMAERMEVASLDVLATAAVRDAEDGAAFVQQLQTRYRVKVRVLSGEEEARYGAQGIIASVYDPLGLSADLGGGSMEVAQVTPRAIGAVASTPLGGLRIADSCEGDIGKMKTLIAKELAKVEWLGESHPHMLYGIGGGFRALAKLHMKKSHYPLEIMHEYVMSKRAVSDLTEKLCKCSMAELMVLPGISEKRAATLIPTALVLQQLMQHSGARQVMMSVSGIREGFFFDLLPAPIQQEDPLIASSIDLAALIGRRGKYAKELYQWMNPLFAHEPIPWARLRHALCILSELAWAIDPNFRAQWAYHRIIQSSLKGLDHKERLMLALALFHRYQTKWKGEQDALRLLDERERIWARCVGLAANLAFNLSGGKAGNLHHASLQVHESRVTLTLDEEASPLRTETVEKRLDGLGDAFRAFANFVI